MVMMRFLKITAISFLVLSLFCNCGSSQNNNSAKSVPAESQVKAKSPADPRIISLGSDEFETKLFSADSDELIILLDVRTPQEFAQGHIKGAINVDVRDSDFIKNAEKALKIKKGRVLPTVAVYCRSGVRSLKAAELLLKKECAKKVYNLEPGINGWRGEILK